MGTEVDLSTCEREPIHIPERVQAHGALVAVDPDSGVVRRVSANVEDYTGRTAERWLGAPLGDCLPGVANGIGERLADTVPRALWAGALDGADDPVEVVGHRHDGALVLEIEPVRQRSRFDNPLRTAMAALRTLTGETSLRGFCGRFARVIRECLGYDRVMIYRFSPDWHGWVFAEARDESLQPFLDLHYPASDIPSQARALFAANPSRLIADVRAEHVPLLPPSDDAPLDLSFASSLRGVSPIHIEYLHNMGVRASLSLALLVEGRLWGLVACHHYADARPLSFDSRVVAEILANSAQMRIAEIEARDEARERAARAVRLREVTSALASNVGMLDGLDACRTSLPKLVGNSSFVAWIDGEAVLVEGDAPSPEIVAAVVASLPSQTSSDVVCETELGARVEASRGHETTAAGLLAVPLTHRPGDWLLWFRPEERQTVTWAGPPDKPAHPGPNGLRLTPRASFDAWVVETQGQAMPWSAVEVEAATSLSTALSDVVFRDRERLFALAQSLEARNRELDGFTAMASHDLREPLRALRNYASFIREDQAEGEDITPHVEAIDRLVKRMNVLVEGLLAFSQLGKGTKPVRFEAADAVEDAVENLAAAVGETGARIEVADDLPPLLTWRVGVVEVFQNLIGNALKYTRDTPHVEIGSVRREDWRRDWTVPPGHVVLFVRDHGIGIDPRHAEGIFRLFRRIHPNNSYGEGAGVGLSMVRKIIERLGGHIWLDSAVGKGSTFYFTVAGTEDVAQ